MKKLFLLLVLFLLPLTFSNNIRKVKADDCTQLCQNIYQGGCLITCTQFSCDSGLGIMIELSRTVQVCDGQITDFGLSTDTCPCHQ